MQAGMYARQLVTALDNDHPEQYQRLLGLADLECRRTARYPRRWDAQSVDKRMKMAFQKWEAIYRAVHERLGNRPPPAPLFFSGPYLNILNELIKEKSKDRYFLAKLEILRRHAVESFAIRCDIFEPLLREHIGQCPCDPTELKRAGFLLDKLYTKYIRCLGPFAL